MPNRGKGKLKLNFCFRTELNRQKQRSHELEMKLETALGAIAEVCFHHVMHTDLLLDFNNRLFY